MQTKAADGLRTQTMTFVLAGRHMKCFNTFAKKNHGEFSFYGSKTLFMHKVSVQFHFHFRLFLGVLKNRGEGKEVISGVTFVQRF